MRARNSGLNVSAVVSLASLGLAYYPGLRMGVELAGGIVIEARAPTPVHAALRDKLGGLGLGPVQVQEFGSPNDVLLRLEQLLRDGLWALGWAAAAMYIYITFRFEWPFAVGAIVTMFLDLTKTVGFVALTGFEFNLTSIAAILTIMGFSINDKIVVYDRVRENLTRFKKMPLAELIDLSINETLTRTIGTSVGLFLAIVPLTLFGGPALCEFAVVLLFGLVLATSSSIFIAAPILLNLGEKRLTGRRTAGVGAILPARNSRSPQTAGRQHSSRRAAGNNPVDAESANRSVNGRGSRAEVQQMWEVLGYLSRLPAQASVAASQLSQPRRFLSSAEMSSGIDGARGSPPGNTGTIG
jgi:SecD/SecF fusion protein